MSGREPFKFRNYHGITSEFESQFGGPPNCPKCGETMFAEDDHGRYKCFCGGSYDVLTAGPVPTGRIPQVTDVLSKKQAENLTDEEKEKIPPIHRLNLPMTKKEAAAFNEIMSSDFYELGIQIDFPEEKKKDREDEEEYEK